MTDNGNYMSWRFSRLILIGLFLLSGFSALLYQLVWVRQLGEVFGRSTYAISTVLACFMGGLALGSWLVGRYKGWQAKPLRWYITIEAGIGLSAAAVSYGMYHISGLYQSFYLQFEPAQLLSTFIRVVFVAPLLIIPTALMGATLPILSRIVFRSEDEIGRDFGALYGFNTLGAALGALVAGFFLFEHLGVRLTLALAVLINGVVALAVGLLRRHITASKPGPADLEKPGKGRLVREALSATHRQFLMLVLFLNGFTALGLEVFWVRMFVYYTGNSTYAFTLILVTHLIGIAGGSWIIGRFADKIRRRTFVLVLLQLATAYSLAAALLGFGGVFRYMLTFAAGDWHTFLLASTAKAVIVLLPPAFMMGTTFPLLNLLLIDSLETAGQRIGRLYALNTIGAIFGSLLAGFFLIQLLGVSVSIALSAAVYGGAAILVAYTIPNAQRRKIMVALSALTCAGMIYLSVKADGLRLATRYELAAEETIFYQEGVSATVKVYQTRMEDRGLVLSANGSIIGADSRSIMRKQAMLAHLPMLLAPEVKNAFIVGLGTGVTLGELLKHPLERIVCAEISTGVIEASHLFTHVNNLNYDDPRLQWVLDDGKIWLANSKDKFDLISSDTMLRRGSSGNGRMYSREYYQIGLEHLSANGLFVQWAPAYLQPDIHRMIIRTFTAVFPYVSGWYLGNETLLLVGSRTPLAVSMRGEPWLPEVKRTMEWIDFPTQESVLATLVFDKAGLQSYAGPGPLNTIDRPLVEFSAPRNFSGNMNVARFLQTSRTVMITPGEVRHDIQWLDQSPTTLANITHQADIYQQVMRGIAARISEGELQAKRIFVQALLQDPQNPHVLHFLGLSKNDPGTYLKSKYFLDAAIILRELGAEKRGLAFLDSARTIAPENFIAHNQYYLRLFESGDLAGAIAAAEEALLTNPNHAGIARDLHYFRSLAE